MSTIGEDSDAPSGLFARAAVIAAIGAFAVVTFEVNRRYAQWAQANSPLAAPRARAAAFRTSYRRKRSGISEITQIVGDLMDAIEQARIARP